MECLREKERLKERKLDRIFNLLQALVKHNFTSALKMILVRKPFAEKLIRNVIQNLAKMSLSHLILHKYSLKRHVRFCCRFSFDAEKCFCWYLQHIYIKDLVVTSRLGLIELGNLRKKVSVQWFAIYIYHKWCYVPRLRKECWLLINNINLRFPFSEYFFLRQNHWV